MPASPQFPDLPATWIETTEVLPSSGTFMRIWSRRDLTTRSRHDLTTGSRNGLAQNPRVLFVVHGFGEHSDRYRHWPFYLNNDVDQIVTSDLYGHGKSPGGRGSCRTSEDWLSGIELAFKHAESNLRQQFSGARVAVLGHSFGGLLVIEMCRQKRWHNVKHIFVSAPLMGLVTQPPAWKTAMGRMIEPLFPQLPLVNEISPEVVSHDPLVIQTYADDPLNTDKITPRAYVQMTELMERTRQETSPLGYPLTLILPGADPLVDARITFKWFQKLETDSSTPKNILGFPGFRHESFNEVHKAIVFNALSNQLAGIFK